MVRSYFYVGGNYEKSDNGEHVMIDQMYVEKLSPTGKHVKNTPVVLIHGKGQTGTVCCNQAI
jgi:hypothetical protein